jgi:RHS repeat-associated protein
LALITPTGIYYYHTDHLGTPQFLTDSIQTVAWQANYDPSGRAMVVTQGVVNNLRFPGQYFEQETGLHYNYYRDYDPTLGRYIQSDPIGLEGGLNTYGYAFQNPLRFADPTGENPTIPIIIAACLGDPVCALPLIAGASHAITKCIDTVRDLTSSPMFNESTDDKPYAGETPDDKPGDFVPIGEGDKRKLAMGLFGARIKQAMRVVSGNGGPTRGRAARVRSWSQLGQMVVCVDYE